MESIHQPYMVRDLLTHPDAISGLKHTTRRAGLHRLLGTAMLAGLLGAAALTPITTHASPPTHANASERAKSNFAEEALPANARAKRGGNDEWARGRILVTPRAGLPSKALTKILREYGGKPTKIGQSDLYVVELPEYTEEGVIARLARHPHIKFAEFDHYVSPTVIPNDPYYPNGWHLPKIGAPAAWGDSLGSDITIAILDSGVEGDHPDLAAKMVSGWNFFDNNSNTSDVSGHGTRVAGAAAALTNNGIGVAGVARHSQIMPIRITDTSGWGTWSGIANGLVWAADRGVRVANISFVGVSSSLSARNAAQYMKNKNGLVIVAAGNTGNLENYTTTDTMIPVAATTSSDARASWSSYGNYVLLSAPGAGIWTTRDGKSYGASNGTSFSSPITAGVIALMMAANPSMKNTDIEQTLFATAVDLGATGWDPYFGHGRVDAGAAVQAVAATVATPIVDTEPPQVTILEPLSGATVSGLVPVDIEATDNVGVVRTELWVNHTSVAVDTSEPFAFSWDSNGTPNGKANLVVRAFDAAGNSADSNVVEVNVDNDIITVDEDITPPVVQIIDPVAGDVSHNVTITVNASDDSGDAGIALAIYIDGQLLATGTGSTLSTNWNTRPRRVSAGTHTIQAVAQDEAGNTATTSVNVNVVK
ncbi:S8 family serine peptidase [Nitrosomonas halophila]|uniref:Subtilase family protein n=1 Tax=Nitrosomonas halophila TaxID=44576 RepID=A0A1H3L9C7_9PROT|nr:S8 family serine peptidase [Nitrosomonas halophila]SDY60538.1 Subtilase family protein [Nitrosomonas halophila]